MLYQSLVGSFMYLMTPTKPGSGIYDGKSQQTKRLGRTFNNIFSETTRYTDSDWAGGWDDRKSTSGYVFTLQGATVSWKSKKQLVVVLPSTEAEYIGFPEAAREAVWFHGDFARS